MCPFARKRTIEHATVLHMSHTAHAPQNTSTPTASCVRGGEGRGQGYTRSLARARLEASYLGTSQHTTSFGKILDVVADERCHIRHWLEAQHRLAPASVHGFREAID